MDDKRTYQRSFGRPSIDYQGQSNFNNRAYSRNDRDNLYNKKRDNSFSLGRNDSCGMDRGYARNQDRISTQSREYSVGSDRDCYLNKSRQLSSHKNFDYKSNKKTYSSSAENCSRPIFEDQVFSKDQSDYLSHSSSQMREYPLNNDEGSNSSRGRHFSRQDNSDYRPNKKTYGTSAKNNMFEEQVFYKDQSDYTSHSSNQMREYPLHNDEGNYSNRGNQYSTQDNFDYRSNKKSFSSSAGNHDIYKDQAFCKDQSDYTSHSSTQMREYPLHNDEANYSNRGNQYSTQDNFDYRSNQKSFSSSAGNHDIYKDQAFCKDQSDYTSHSSTQMREYPLHNDEVNYSNRGKQNSTQDNFDYRSNQKSFSSSAGNNDIYEEQAFCKDQTDHLSSYSNQKRECPSNNNEGNYLKRNKQYSTQGNSDIRSNQNTYSSPALKRGIYEKKYNVFQQPHITMFSLGNPDKEQNQQPWECDDGFGQIEVERQPYSDEYLIGDDTYNQIKSEYDYDEEEDEEVEGKSDNKLYIEDENEMRADEEEDDFFGCNDEEEYNKVNLFIPDHKLVQKYKYFPPPAEEMGKIFNGMVIYFLYKIKEVVEKNPFVIICESFRRSDRFGPLSVEDGYQRTNKYTKFCTLRWNGMMLVRGVGFTGNFKEPRVVAGRELINQLAMSCYSLKEKSDYYGKGAFAKLVQGGANSNIIRVVQSTEVYDHESACNFITTFFKDDNEKELLFKDSDFLFHLINLKRWAKTKGYNVRRPECFSAMCISLRRTPQYWRDKILASGKMENERFELIPPQGYGNELLTNRIFSNIQGLEYPRGLGPRTMYAHNDAGLNISRCKAPWERRRQGTTSRSKTKNKVINKIQQAIKCGEPTQIAGAFKRLRKKDRKKYKKKFGLI